MSCSTSRFNVREVICARLEEMGLLRGDRDHEMSIPVCQRTGDVIEPLLKFQVAVKHVTYK